MNLSEAVRLAGLTTINSHRGIITFTALQSRGMRISGTHRTRLKISRPGDRIVLILKGMAMGIAEVIPGVSGGTIAFITGIYERLILAIRSFDIHAIELIRRSRMAHVWRYIDGTFLLLLILGMALGIIGGVFGVTRLMDTHPEALWAFFFGLILASAWYVGRKVPRWKYRQVIGVIAGAVVAYLITRLSPAEGSAHVFYVLFCGFVAVSALMLPGISGSFILLLLGMYTVIIPALKSVLTGHFDKIGIVLVFAVGMAAGLMTISRVLTWLFRHYYGLTLAILSGFMLGSLGRIWPWRNPVRWIETDGTLRISGIPGEGARILTESIVLPSQYMGDAHVLPVILSFIAGLAIVYIASRIEAKS